MQTCLNIKDFQSRKYSSDPMSKIKVLYESQESILGQHRQSKEWIEYSLHIKISETDKNPVKIQMDFVPPHPFIVDMPERHLIKANDLSRAFTKIYKYLNRMGFELKE